MSFWRGGTELPESPDKALAPEQEAVLEKVARKVVDKGMAVPAILFLESVKPLNFIGSQVLVFFEPIVQTLFNFKDYTTFRETLERRESIEILLRKIEAHDAVAFDRNKRIKKYLKQERKKWKWYQRYLGVFTPKVQIPDEVVKPTEGDPQGGKPSS